MEENRFATKEYKRSRYAYALQCTFEYLVLLLMEDAFLAKLLSYLGLDDKTTGIIASFGSLAFTVQILSVFLFRKKQNAKKICTPIHTVSLVLFLFLYLIPFTPWKTNAKIIVMVIILVGHALRNLVSTVLYQWANGFVEGEHRALFSSKKEILSLISGMAFTLIVGYVFDTCEKNGNIETGFGIIAALILFFSILNFICLALIEKADGAPKETTSKESTASLREVVKHTLGNQAFRSVILMTVFWESGRFFLTGFMGIYKTKDLLLSVFLIQLFNIVASLSRVFVSKPFGRFSDKTSFAKGIETALLIACLAFCFVIFTTPKTWYFVLPYTVLYSVCMAGINANSFNISYSYVDEKYISEAMAIKSLIGGLFGFGSSLLAARVLDLIQQNGNSLFGIPVYGQQVLAIGALLFTLIAFCLTKFVIEKQKTKKQ